METPTEPGPDAGPQPPEAGVGPDSGYVPPPPLAPSTSIGVLALVIAGLAELLGFFILFSGCSAYGAADFLLVVATVALLGGGTASLVVGTRRGSGRALGVAALIAGVISLPINFLLVGLSGFCVTG